MQKNYFYCHECTNDFVFNNGNSIIIFSFRKIYKLVGKRVQRINLTGRRGVSSRYVARFFRRGHDTPRS
ncbi:MAG: DUF3797 domain-containing protein [Bacteroidetes bacterium]|nr:DUF3797 domain-containing protein [Bacteroidota bacterium]